MHLSAARRRLGTGLAAAVVASFLTAAAFTGQAAAAPAAQAPAPHAPASAASAGDPDLGPNVLVFDPSMPQAQIQAAVDAVAARQISDQFGTGRFALLFKPGTYGSAAQPLRFGVGYYTEVAGLGRNPTDVQINGSIDVLNQCFPTPPGAPTDCTALVNFWRSMSNLTINVMGQTGCQTGSEFWAVSQAAPMRRVQINGGLSLMDFCSAGPQFASGGFISDSAVSGDTDQRQPAAVHRPQLQPQRLVERRLEPGLRGHRRRPAAELPDPAVHDPGHQPGLQGAAVPVRRRGRQVERLRPVAAAQRRRHDLGERPDPGHVAAAVPVLPGQAG